MKRQHFFFSACFLIPLLVIQTYAANRAIVFGTTCPYYEQTLDDVGVFGQEEIPEFDALKNAGWDVVPFYGGKSVWCDPSSDPTCKPTKYGSFDQVLKGSSFQKSQIQEASSTHILDAMRDALSGPHALNKNDQLLLSIVTHGDGYGFCSSDGEVGYLQSQSGSFAQLLKQLSEKGIKVGIDANHCFSGGVVKELSLYGCVVSVSSATTTGLAGSTTIADVLKSPASPVSMEDLFLARLASPDSAVQFRQPEISGFTPGNQQNDQLSNMLYPGDKYDLNNASEFIKYFMITAGGSPTNCDTCTDQSVLQFYQKYQQMLSSWEDTSEEIQSTDFLKKLALSLPAGVDPGFLTSGTFYSDLEKDLNTYMNSIKQFKQAAQDEKDGIMLIQQAQFAAYAPNWNSMAAPGTADTLRAAYDGVMKQMGPHGNFLSSLPDANGKMNNALDFSNIFMDSNKLKALAGQIVDRYARISVSDAQIIADCNTSKDCPKWNGNDSSLQNYRNQWTTWVNNTRDKRIADFEALYQQPILKGLTQARDQMLASLPASQQEPVKKFLTGYSTFFPDQIPIQAQNQKTANALQAKLSARISLALDSSYTKYKQKLDSGSTNLSPSEQTDKTMLDSCSQFNLTPNH